MSGHHSTDGEGVRGEGWEGEGDRIERAVVENDGDGDWVGRRGRGGAASAHKASLSAQGRTVTERSWEWGWEG